MDVPAVPYKDLLQQTRAESSTHIRQRVTVARDTQHDRFSRSKIFCNAQMTSRQIKNHCIIDNASQQLLEIAIDKLGLSARAHNRILKIARTLADLELSPQIAADHIAEAIQYRTLDRKR